MPVASPLRKEAVVTEDVPPRRRVALVTGASRGIGRATALALARAGCNVALASRHNERMLDVAAEIAAAGARSFPVEIDVTDPISVEAGVAAVAAALGPVNVLVNNAGMASSKPFQKLTIEDWGRVFAVNALGPFLVTHACLPPMIAAEWGRIVNVASTAAVQGYRYTAHYTASKHALLGMTRALALEVATKGITVNCVCPGFVDTEMTRETIENISRTSGRTRGQALAALEAESPQRRLMSPEEVAAAIVYLCSDDARGVNGQAIVLNG